MAIKMRRGRAADFDPSALVSGEIAVIKDEKKVKVSFTDDNGADVKEVLFKEDTEFLDGVVESHIDAELDGESGNAISNATATHYIDMLGNAVDSLEINKSSVWHTHDNATTSYSGFMSDIDKVKLNGIQPNAEVNQNAFGHVAIGSSEIDANSKTDTLNLTNGNNVTLRVVGESDNKVVEVNSSDTKYAMAVGAGTEGNNHYADIKINGDDNSTDYVRLLLGDWVNTYPSGKKLYFNFPDFVGSGSNAAKGLVPKPPTTAGIKKVLCEDGTWKDMLYRLRLENVSGFPQLSFKDFEGNLNCYKLKGQGGTTVSIGDSGGSIVISSPNYQGAGAHNSQYRGKNLGTSVTAAQYAAIQDGTFDDMYIGDYWVIDDVTWRIAAFNRYKNTGDTICTDNHVVIVPDTVLVASAKMNDTGSTATGYSGCKMRTDYIDDARDVIKAAFGAEHILSYRNFFVSQVSGGTLMPSNSTWADADVEMMNEKMLTGSNVYAPAVSGQSTLPRLSTLDMTILPLFVFNPILIREQSATSAGYWLRDTVTNERFSTIASSGISSTATADSTSYGIRPYFCLYSPQEVSQDE